MKNKRLKAARLDANLTLLEVAKELGVSEATVQRYESGAIKNIKIETIKKLANLYKITPSYLVGWTENSKEIRNNNHCLAE